MYDTKDVEIGVTLTDDKHRPVQTMGVRRIEESGIRVDTVFMTRQLCDIVPNPWQAHEFSKQVLVHFKENGEDREHNERLIANNFVFLIEELRKQLECEKDRLAEQVFRSMLKADELRFIIIGNNFDWTLPKSKKWNQLGPAMKDKILRFEVLSEDEWEAKLNSILLG
ncbi:MAG: hypothetical protein AB9866_29030 [Syntrophobacteraceae bacterium]